MSGKLWKKCVNYETISYLVCGVLTTAVDFVSYTAFRKMSMGVGVSQALSWVAAVLLAYIVNKIIVFRNFNMGPAYLLKEGGDPGCRWVKYHCIPSLSYFLLYRKYYHYPTSW